MKLLKITTNLLSMLVLAAFTQTAMADRFETVTPFIGTKLGIGVLAFKSNVNNELEKKTRKHLVLGLKAGIKYKQFGLAVNGETMLRKNKENRLLSYKPVTLDAIFMLPVGEKSSIDFTVGAGYAWYHMGKDKIASSSIAKLAVEYNYYVNRNVAVGFMVDRLIGTMSAKDGDNTIAIKSLLNASVGLKYHFM